jgi:exopolysaccharide biosynthesis WecB/TagA/CpsF family protein
MIDKGKYNLLGVQMSAVDYAAAVDKIITAAHERRNLAVTALAVHGVMTGVSDAEHRYRLNHFDLVVPDGQPVRWALNMMHKTALPDRVYGPNLTLYVCERAAKEGLPIFLYGSKPETLERLEANLKARMPQLQVAGKMPSQFRRVTAEEKLEIAQAIQASGAAIVLVGLGCPRQEVWVYEHMELLPMPLLAVGAAFDFHAGTLSQAPKFMQDRGLEWFYRLTREPMRLWRRYLILNPLYLMLVAQQLLKVKRFDEVLPKPEQELRYG